MESRETLLLYLQGCSSKNILGRTFYVATRLQGLGESDDIKTSLGMSIAMSLPLP